MLGEKDASILPSRPQTGQEMTGKPSWNGQTSKPPHDLDEGSTNIL
jgi:hypothetical protein